MDWTDPPSSYESLCMWRVYIATCEAEVWQVVCRWYKKYGNPFIVPDNESMDEYESRQHYQNALRFCYHKSH